MHSFDRPTLSLPLDRCALRAFQLVEDCSAPLLQLRDLLRAPPPIELTVAPHQPQTCTEYVDEMTRIRDECAAEGKVPLCKS